MLALGGDGTILRTVQSLDGAEVPIIGVNVGLLGYLAEVEPFSMLQALERFFSGRFHARGADDVVGRDRTGRSNRPRSCPAGR